MGDAPALLTGIGWCLDCQADVAINERGRCACGGLAIPPSTGRRIVFPNSALSETWVGRRTPWWSVKYERCQECGQTDSPHNAHGRCSRCTVRLRDQARRQAARQ